MQPPVPQRTAVSTHLMMFCRLFFEACGAQRRTDWTLCSLCEEVSIKYTKEGLLWLWYIIKCADDPPQHSTTSCFCLVICLHLPQKKKKKNPCVCVLEYNNNALRQINSTAPGRGRFSLENQSCFDNYHQASILSTPISPLSLPVGCHGAPMSWGVQPKWLLCRRMLMGWEFNISEFIAEASGGCSSLTWIVNIKLEVMCPEWLNAADTQGRQSKTRRWEDSCVSLKIYYFYFFFSIRYDEVGLHWSNPWKLFKFQKKKKSGPDRHIQSGLSYK